MNFEGSGLSELESKVVFLAELGEKSGNPFFHHGVYHGVIQDDMLVLNSSIFLSIDQNRCKEIVEELRANDILLIRPGDERATSYTNYYYAVTSFTNKEKVLEKIGKEALEKATKLISERPELIETLGFVLISRYKGFRLYVNKEELELDPELLDLFTKNFLLFKNRFVYTGKSSGINFFIPDTPFFELLDNLNRKFLTFLFNELLPTKFSDADSYEEFRERILIDPSIKKLGLDSYDTKLVDYIFDLAKTLGISIPIQYRQLYDRYKESIISLKILETLSSLLRASIEALEHAIMHYKRGTLSDFRLAIISVDNTIELILRNHLLKQDVTTESMKKINFHSLLKKCKDIEFVADNLEKFKQFHAARNQLYHMPLGIVDKYLIKGAINLAKNLFEIEANEKLKL